MTIKLKEDNMEDSAIQKVSPETRKMIMSLRARRHATRKQKADKTKRLSVKVNEANATTSMIAQRKATSRAKSAWHKAVDRGYGDKDNTITHMKKVDDRISRLKKKYEDAVNAHRKPVSEAKKERKFGWEHQKKIALRTLELSKVGANVLGGMTHDQAKHFLDSNGIKYDKRLVENNFFDNVRPGHIVHYLNPQGQERKGKVVMNQGTHLVLNRGDGQPQVVTQKNFIKSVDGGKVRSALLSNVAKAMKDTGGKLKEASDIEKLRKQAHILDTNAPVNIGVRSDYAHHYITKLNDYSTNSRPQLTHSKASKLAKKDAYEFIKTKHGEEVHDKLKQWHSDNVSGKNDHRYQNVKSKDRDDPSIGKELAQQAREYRFNKEDHEASTDDHYGPGASNMNKAVAALRKKLRKEYDENEDENRHSENAVLLAKHFGTPDELERMKHMLKTRDKIGHLHSDHIGYSAEMSKKYGHKLHEDRSDVEASAQRVAIAAREKLLKNRRKKKTKKSIKEEVLTAVDWDNVETSHHSVRASTYGGIPLKHHVARLMAAGIQSKPTHSPYMYHNGLLVQAKHREKANKILFGADLPYNPMKRQLTTEVSAPGQEAWIKANKRRFIARYGKEKGTKILYAKAWKMSNQQESSGSDLPPVHQIARGIRKNWKKEYFGAVPYLDAMHSLETAHDDYGADTGHSVIAYGLSNMSSYSGKSVHDPELAKVHRAQLKAHLKAPKPIREALAVSDEQARLDRNREKNKQVVLAAHKKLLDKGYTHIHSDSVDTPMDGQDIRHHYISKDRSHKKIMSYDAYSMSYDKAPEINIEKKKLRTKHSDLKEGFKDLVRGIFSKKKEPKFFVHPERKTKTGVPNPTKFMTYGQFHKHLNSEVTEARESEFRANMHMGTGADLRKKGKVEPKKPHNQLDAMLAIHKAMKQARQGGVDEATMKPKDSAKAYDVYLKGKHIDTVWFTGYDNESAKKSLINHDGYHSAIVVKSRNLKEASEEKVKKTAERAIQLAKKKIKGNQTANVKPELQVPAGNAVNSTLEGNHAEVGDGVSNHV
jgi:hypothetical protein